MDFPGLFADYRTAPENDIVADQIPEYTEQSGAAGDQVYKWILGSEGFMPNLAMRCRKQMSGKKQCLPFCHERYGTHETTLQE
jgi:hypothetical protein